MKKIVFTGGGTLGHVMPNLYLIEELNNDYLCSYIGSSGIEAERIEKFNVETSAREETLSASKSAASAPIKKVDFYSIPTVKFQRGKIFGNLKIPFALIRSIKAAKRVLKEIKPDLIFSKGGYVALPVCLAGRMLRIPIVAHESDSSFGLANRIIFHLAKFMCVNFSSLAKKSKKIQYTGPIFSAEFEKNRKNRSGLKLDDNKPTLLIVGGSLGSKIINDMIFPLIKDLIHDFNVIHLTGKGNLKIKSFDNYNVFEMREDMVNLYNLADFYLGRSGAGVTAEAFYKKLPMILIPLENKASRGDQKKNASYYEREGVAKILRECELTPTLLLKAIQQFYKNIENYKAAYKQLNPTNGKQRIVGIIKGILK